MSKRLGKLIRKTVSGLAATAVLVAGLTVMESERTPAEANTAGDKGTDNSIDYSIKFSDNTQYLKSESPGPIPASSDFTVEGWFFDPAAASGKRVLLSQMVSAGTASGFEIKIEESGFTHPQEISVLYDGLTTNVQVLMPKERWTHLAVSVTGTTFEFYFDGVKVANWTDSTVGTVTGPVFLGTGFSDPNLTGAFPGKVDQVKIWKRGLTADQVAQSMHTWGAEGMTVGSNHLVAHYDFNDRSFASTNNDGVVFNKADNTFPLQVFGAATFEDVKTTTASGGVVSHTFPRSYLTENGGWSVPTGVTKLTDVLVVGGGGGGGSVGGGGGGGGSAQFGSLTVIPTLPIKTLVGQGGPADKDGQSSFVYGLGPEVEAQGGKKGSPYSSSAQSSGGAGGSSLLVPAFTRYDGATGGAGPDYPYQRWDGNSWSSQFNGFVGNADGKIGIEGPTIAGIKYGGGGGGGASSFIGNDDFPVIVSRAAGGQGGGGQGAGVGLFGTEFTCPGDLNGFAGDPGQQNTGYTPTVNGLGGSTGGAGTPNTGGGGGGGLSFGDPCAGSPNTPYDGERTAGGQGGSGVIKVSYTRVAPPVFAPLTVTATRDLTTNVTTATWNNPGINITRVSQFRVNGGPWTQLISDTVAVNATAMFSSVAGHAEFRVAYKDTSSGYWSEWFYSNPVAIVAPANFTCTHGATTKIVAQVPGGKEVFLSFGGVNATTGLAVQWGDGVGIRSRLTTSTQNPKYTYPTAGSYLIQACGLYAAFGGHTGNPFLTEILEWGAASASLGSLYRAFLNAPILVRVPKTLPSTVTQITEAFSGATIFNSDISGWSSAFTDMGAVFRDAKRFNVDIGNWNTTNTFGMNLTFDGASAFNQDLSNWNTSNVRNMGGMFNRAASFNNGGKPLAASAGKWNTSKATSMAGMFSNARKFNQPLTGWVTSNVASMGQMFQGAISFNRDLVAGSGDGVWDTSKVTNMQMMFSGASSFNGNISSWNVSSVMTMTAMFQSAFSFNQDLSSWDTSNVIQINQMFLRASSYSFKPPTKFKKVTDATSMLDYSGISNHTYGQTLIAFADSVKAGEGPGGDIIFGAVDKLVLCSEPTHREAYMYLYNLSWGQRWSIRDSTLNYPTACDPISVVPKSVAPNTYVYGNPLPSIGFDIKRGADVLTLPLAYGPTGVACKIYSRTGGTDTEITSTTTDVTPVAGTTYITKCTGPATTDAGLSVNYSATGTFTISKRPISITVQNKVDKAPTALFTTRSGNTADYAITTGSLVSGDGVQVTVTAGAEITPITAPKKYPLVGSLSGAKADNYRATFTNGTLTYSEANKVVLKVANVEKIYGQTATLPAVSCDPNCTGIDPAPVATSDGVAASAAVGNYEIDILNATSTADRYVVVEDGGEVIVKKRALVVTPVAQTLVATSLIPAYSYTIAAADGTTGFVSGEGESSGSGLTKASGYVAPVCTSGYSPATPASTIPITCSGGSADNYYFVYNSANLTVTAKPAPPVINPPVLPITPPTNPPAPAPLNPEITVTNTTPTLVGENATSGLISVPFSFEVSPLYASCFANLRISYTDGGGEKVVLETLRQEITSSPVVFNRGLGAAIYEYEFFTDGNCSSQPYSNKVNVGPLSYLVDSFNGLPVVPWSQLGIGLGLNPTLGKMSPASFPAGFASEGTVTGSSLNQVASIMVDGKNVPIIRKRDGSIRFKLPKLAPGTYDMVLTLEDGSVATWSGAVIVSASKQPDPKTLKLKSYPANKASKTTLRGLDLEHVVGISIDGKKAKLIKGATKRIDFRVPKLKRGVYDVLLTLGDGSVFRWEQSIRIGKKSKAQSSSEGVREFTNFAPGSAVLPSSVRRELREFLVENRDKYSKVECVGYTDGPFVRRIDVPLAMKRADTACDFAKQLGYEVTSKSYVNKQTPGALLRKVKIILGK